MKQRSAFAIVLWLLFVLACGIIAGRTIFTADLSAFLPSHPSANQQLFADQLQNGIASRLILIGIEGDHAETLARISRDVARQLRDTADFISVNNGEPVGAERDRNFLFSHRYLLSPAVTAERFTIKGLHDAIAESIDMLASPAGLLIKPLLTRDPTGETLQLLDGFNSGARPHSAAGIWISHDGKRAVLLAQTKAAGSDTDGQQRAMTLISQAFNHAVGENGGSAVKLVMTGPGVFAVDSRNTIKKEVTRLSILSTAIVVTLLFLVYRSFTALALGILPVATGILAGIAAVSLGFGTVHGVTLGFGITLIGEAVDYSIYLFIQSQHDDKPEREQDRLPAFWPTIRLGVMTSVIGFAALLFSGFPGLEQLGLYSTVGLIAAAIMTRFVLPVMIPRGFRIRDVSRLGSVLAVISRHAIPLRWITALLMLTACAVLYGQRQDLWNNDLSALSPVSAENRALDATLRNDLGAPDPRYLVIVSGDSMESALIAAEKTAAKLEPLVDDGVIAGFDSPSRYLPSVTTQSARLAAIPPAAELTKRLQAAVSDLPLRAARLADFVRDAEAARSAGPLRRSDLTGTSMALAVDALLIDHGKRWSALLPLHTPATGTVAAKIDPQRIRAALAETGLSNAVFVDVKAELDRIYSGYLREAIHLSLAGFAAILGLLLIALRSPQRVARVVLPLVIAVIVVAAGLAWCGYRLTILHLVGMLLIAAVGSNYALFFDRGSYDITGRAYARTLASLLFANMTTVTVFGLLAFSSVPILQNIGMTVAPGVVLALLFSAILAERRSTMIPGLNRI